MWVVLLVRASLRVRLFVLVSFMDMFIHVIGGGVVALLMVVAMPNIVHQAVSDDGDGWSGACPGYESHAEVWGPAECENSLPPTMEMEVER